MAEAVFLVFGSILDVAEETRAPERTIPLVVVLSVVATTVLYVTVALSAVALVDPAALGLSGSPLADVALAGWVPLGAQAVGAITLFSTTNTVLILLVSTSRLFYGVSKAEYRAFPAVFSRVHPTRRTPHYAVFAVGALTVPFVLLGDVWQVAGVANLLLAVFCWSTPRSSRFAIPRPTPSVGFGPR